MKIRKILSVLTDVSAVCFFVYLLIFPQHATEPTRFALEFCGKTLIPSLFIYMVLSKMIISLQFTQKLSKVLGLETFFLLIGILCGAPIGAKNALFLYESGRITKKHAEFLCSFTNNASLSFVVGFVGSELFGDIKMGVKLLIFQLIASVLTAVIIKFYVFGKEKLPKPIPVSARKTGLREAVADSALTMINLCACVIFFIVAGDALCHIFSFSPRGTAVLKSALEFSSGCAAAQNAGEYALAITAFAIGITGFSVWLQVKSVISNKLSFRPFFLGKLLCGAVMTLLAIIFG